MVWLVEIIVELCRLYVGRRLYLDIMVLLTIPRYSNSVGNQLWWPHGNQVAAIWRPLGDHFLIRRTSSIYEK